MRAVAHPFCWPKSNQLCRFGLRSRGELYFTVKEEVMDALKKLTKLSDVLFNPEVKEWKEQGTRLN